MSGKSRATGARLAETALIDPHHPVAAREMRHPGTPRLGVLGEAVNKQNRVRPRPRIGVIVNGVEQLAVGQLEVGHGWMMGNG